MYKKMKYFSMILASLAVGFLLLVPVEGQLESKSGKAPRNVILMIGDGMGLSQLSSAYYFQEDTTKYKEPSFSRFSYIGLSKTSSGAERVTQSPAAATALATGHKTYNMAVGVDLDTVPRENIVELLSKQGYLTGVIATSHITDATPAGFYAHQPDRYMQREIAQDLVTSDIDFFAGGGLNAFIDTTGRDVFKENNIQAEYARLKKIKKAEPGDRYGFLLAMDYMPPVLNGRKDFLEEATSIAIDFLSTGESGFFLMVEGSQIDWAGHGNNVPYMISEVNDFEKTVGQVLDFADTNGETLVIVTADHETGGYTLGAAGENGYGADYSIIAPTFASTNHSAALVPVLAYGPGAENFIGIYENTEIFHKLVSLLISE
jgi:alkaline phosphatase